MPTTQQVEQFMKPARKLAAAFVQIQAGDTSKPDPDHPVLVAAANQAFALAQGYLCRQFYKGEYCYRWRKVGREIRLPVVPVESVTEVKADGTVIDPSDYELVGDRIEFAGGEHAGSSLGSGAGFVYGFDTLDRDFLFRIVDVTFVGGYVRSDSDASFNNAMAEQSAAQYRRAPFVGLSANAGGNEAGSVTVGSDKGSLIAGVELQLAPLVYTGEAEELRCP